MLEMQKHGMALVHRRRYPASDGIEEHAHDTQARGNHFHMKSHRHQKECTNQENQGRLLARGDICGMNRIAMGGRFEKVSKRTEVYLN